MPRRPLLAAFALTLACRGEPSTANRSDAAKQTEDTLVVTTDRGQVRGATHGRAQAFLGIPYAAPPVAERRFRAPEPPSAWDGVLDASSFGSNCPQMGLLGTVVGDEDCLTLNLWRPSDAPSRALPVLVFIHGGNNTLGSGADPHHNGRRLVENHDVIVVTFNYRLGLLGFLAHPALTSESGTSGNWAYLDQIAVLDWVSNNIAAFGGDPDQVTIVGESAGALGVCVLLASPLAVGTFDGAIMQSGGCDMAPLAQREREGEQLAASACVDVPDPIACLRSLSATQLVTLAPTVTRDITDWALAVGGAVDGFVLPDSPWNTFAAGSHSVVPTMVGSNADETELIATTPIRTCTDYELAIRATFADASDEVLAEYPCESYATARYAYVHATTDATFTCQTRRILRALAPAAGAASTPLFRYWYSHVRADPAVRFWRAYHGSEVQLLFGTMRRLGGEAFENEQALADIMQTSWATFAASGSPIHARTPAWTPYDVTRDNAVVFDVVVAAADGVGTSHCEFWDRRRAARGHAPSSSEYERQQFGVAVPDSDQPSPSTTTSIQ
jgi:para-nitrobenzyl esterase